MRRIATFTTVSIASAILIFFGLCKTVEAQTASLHSITIKVKNVRNNTGRVCVDLFNTPKGFPTKRTKAFKQKCGTIAGGTATITFDSIPPGVYAGFAFHDEDNNGDIKKNWVGMPKEGVGASNNAKGRFGPPSFKAAQFTVTDQRTIVSFKLRYL